MGKSKDKIAVGYVRLSRDDNKQSYTSIEGQKVVINKFAEANGLKISKFYEDDGVSGYSFDRPAFNEMLEEIHEGRIGTVIAKDFSRIGRNNPLSLLFVQNMEELGVRLVLVHDNFDSHNESNEDDMVGIKTWMNERYVRENSKKIKTAIKNKQENGDFVCSVPYGYKLHPDIKHKPIVDTDCAHHIPKIFQLYIDGNGLHRVSKILTEEKIPTPSMIKKMQAERDGKEYRKAVTDKWSSKMVGMILKNDFYIGTLRQGKYSLAGINGKIVVNDKDDHIVIEDNHEAIIDKKTFKLANEILTKRRKENYRGSGQGKKVNTYAGFLKCADCGKGMTVLNKEKRGRAYTCSTYNRYGKKYCSTHYVLDDDITRHIKDFLRLARNGLENIILRFDKTVQERLLKKENYNSVIYRFEKDLVKANEELKVIMTQKVKEMSANPEMRDIISETYEAMQKEKLETVSILKKQIAEFKEMSEKTTELKEDLKTSLSVFDDIISKDGIERADLELIIDKILVHEDGGLELLFKHDIGELINVSPEEFNRRIEVDRKEDLLADTIAKIIVSKRKYISYRWLKLDAKVGGKKKIEIVLRELQEMNIISKNGIDQRRPYIVNVELSKEAEEYYRNKRFIDDDKAGGLYSNDVPEIAIETLMEISKIAGYKNINEAKVYLAV